MGLVTEALFGVSEVVSRLPELMKEWKLDLEKRIKAEEKANSRNKKVE